MIGAGLAEAGASARARHEMIRSRTSRASVRDEPLAQLAEHLTFNQGVGGSIPPRLTIPFAESFRALLAFSHCRRSTPLLASVLITVLLRTNCWCRLGRRASHAPFDG